MVKQGQEMRFGASGSIPRPAEPRRAVFLPLCWWEATACPTRGPSEDTVERGVPISWGLRGAESTREISGKSLGARM